VIAIAASAATLALASRHDADRFAESAQATDAIAKSLRALSARLDSIDKVKPRDDFSDLRRALGEVKASSSHDLDAALARISQRIDSLDHEQTARVDRLGERLDQTTETRQADLAQRLDKLEKKAAAPPAPAAPTAAPPTLGTASVSMERTGSISAAPTPSREAGGSVARARPVLSGYVVLGANPDAAVIANRWGERAFRIGDVIPGAGRVERIERRGPGWVVRTEAGLIPAAQFAPPEAD
jgi:hypothetical protein